MVNVGCTPGWSCGWRALTESCAILGCGVLWVTRIVRHAAFVKVGSTMSLYNLRKRRGSVFQRWN